MPYGSSDMKAWPMCDPQLRTPGIVRSSLQARTETRVSSGPDVSGVVTQCIRKSRSLKLGRRSCPRNGTTAMPATTVSGDGGVRAGAACAMIGASTRS